MLLLVLSGLLAAPFTLAETQQINALETPLAPALTAPATAAEVSASATVRDPLRRPWQSDQWLTAGLQFLIRGKEALGWSLGIQESGFDSPALRQTYQKTLTIVNSLFILGLLAIAGLWLFNVFIPRRYLQRVMLVYAFAVVFINFALPFNRLLIDGTNLLQQAFLTKQDGAVEIADIVRTPDYVEATAYTQAATTTLTHTSRTVTVELPKQIWEDGKTIARLTPDRETEFQKTSQLKLGTDQPFLARFTTDDPPLETAVFHFAMLFLTGLAYLLLALVFTLRIVLLWALLILSPALLFLSIFRSTRGYFYQWISLYGRWLFIGPLAALGIALTVNIWKLAGIPIASAYASEMSFGLFSNLAFYLPGRAVPNTLSTTPQMMEYLIFLMMLYLPLFFAFVLTRQKHFDSLWGAAAETTSHGRERGGRAAGDDGGARRGAPLPDAAATSKNTGLVHQFKGFVDRQLGRIAPGGRAPGAGAQNFVPLQSPGARIETASSLLPQQLALLPTRQLMGVIGHGGESRHDRQEAISKMAFPERLTDNRERHTVETIRQEVEKRAALGDAEAVLIQNEIKSYRSEAPMPSAPAPAPEIHVEIASNKASPGKAAYPAPAKPNPAATNSRKTMTESEREEAAEDPKNSTSKDSSLKKPTDEI